MLLTLATIRCVQAQTIINPSLEQWATPTVCETNLAPDFWTNFSNGGLGPDEGNYPLCPSTIPGNASSGQVYARFMAGNPRSGEGMAQSVSGFSAGKPYSLTFDYAGSNLWGGSDSMRVHVFLDGVDIDSTSKFSSLDTVWRHHVATFIPTASTHTIGVRIYTHRFPSAGGSGALDNFGLQEFMATGVDALQESTAWEIKPSGNAGAFFLAGPIGQSANCLIFDASGRVVYSALLSVGEIIRPELPDGMYQVIVSSQGQLLCRKKFVSLR
ncbi:MAG: T9SS type A sorting domain-containing protein [Bacteroidota bacterium]